MRYWIQRLIAMHLSDWYLPDLRFIGVIEILIIAVLVYKTMLWIKNTKAWMLLRGLLAIGAFILIATIFQMSTILFLARASINILAIGTIVVFQPELRRALEKLGEKNIFSIDFFERNRGQQRFSNDTRNSLIDASIIMGMARTGALIVVEQIIHLTEYEMTGIKLDSVISKQILLNIFESTTPLHDGAVIVRGDRIASATCYLPLSDNMQISKDLGTRHRAALGISEVSDAFVIVVSEESGLISIAYQGNLDLGVTPEHLSERLRDIQYKEKEVEGKKPAVRKGKNHEKV